MRIFLGVVEIAGFYRSLQRGFEQLGIPATFVTYTQHPFGYGGSQDPLLLRLLSWSWRKERKNKYHHFLYKRLSRFFHRLFFLWAALRHDVFIFGFNSSILPNHEDLPILKRMGKKIIYQAHGSDSRPPYIDEAVVDLVKTIEGCISETAHRKSLIEKIDRYADVVIDIPQQGLFRQKPFINWLKIGLPCVPSQQAKASMERSVETVQNRVNAGNFPEIVRILHCPSHPKSKGSAIISRVIEELKAESFSIEYVTVTGQPNAVVMEELAKCDLVIDQLFADYGMPGFASESAWFAKPVLICGYGKPIWDNLLTPEETPPTFYVVPEMFKEALIKLIEDHAFRIELGLKARQFVESCWNPRAVAEKYLRVIREEIPESWWCDPKDTRYVHGYGRTEEEVRAYLTAYVAQGGIEALHLDDKPELLQYFMNFIHQAQSVSQVKEAHCPSMSLG